MGPPVGQNYPTSSATNHKWFTVNVLVATYIVKYSHSPLFCRFSFLNFSVVEDFVFLNDSLYSWSSSLSRIQDFLNDKHIWIYEKCSWPRERFPPWSGMFPHAWMKHKTNTTTSFWAWLKVCRYVWSDIMKGKLSRRVMILDSYFRITPKQPPLYPISTPNFLTPPTFAWTSMRELYLT